MEALVEYNYEAQEPDELTIRKGDLIKDIKVSNGGWWEGTLRDKRGMFPDNFVKVLDQTGSARNSGDKSSKNEEVTLRNGSGRKFCRVLFSYEPNNDDELKLTPDEAIEYLGEVEEGWWRGRIRGNTGVFPSNFVSAPTPEEAERNKEKKEFCRVLYPYEAANDDELTLGEGEIITLLSREAPDKGWWKGEIKGRIGYFPDNFVELITLRNDHTDGQVNQLSSAKSLAKNQTGKRKETAGVRKSLDTRNLRIDSAIKKNASSASGSTTEKKPSNIISSLKRLVGDSSNNTAASSTVTSNNGNAGSALGEELDEVERGEPLSHLTASRAKAPRRRLPSNQLRHQNPPLSPSAGNSNNMLLPDDNMTNGNSEVLEPSPKDDESDGLLGKSKRKPPWVEELKLNQMERRKMGTDRTDKVEIKKERQLPWLPSSASNSDVTVKSELDHDDYKPKEKEREKNMEKEVKEEKYSPSRMLDESPLQESPVSPPISSPSSTPAYVPYHLYSQLLDRIAVLEEKQTVLQRKVNQLTDQLAPFIANATSDKD